MTSDYSVTGSGVGIGWFSLTRLYHNGAACMFSHGTSMAAPHVAGVAAMCVQYYIKEIGPYTPENNYLQIINALLNGAEKYDSLNEKVSGKRMLNAPGAIAEVSEL